VSLCSVLLDFLNCLNSVTYNSYEGIISLDQHHLSLPTTIPIFHESMCFN
jgi:hypothetical protein